MQKLTRKALSLVLCIAIVVSAISCVFTVTAETGSEGGNTVTETITGTISDDTTWNSLTFLE